VSKKELKRKVNQLEDRGDGESSKKEMIRSIMGPGDLVEDIIQELEEESAEVSMANFIGKVKKRMEKSREVNGEYGE